MKRSLAAIAVAMVLGLAGLALARPGGGHSFSSGHSSSSHSYGGGGHSYGGGGHSSSSSSYGGGGGCGDADFGGFIVVIVVLVIIYGVKFAVQQSQGAGQLADNWSTAYTPSTSFTPPPPALDLAAVTSADPDFSVAVFEDFAYQLYAAAHLARADAGKLAALAPYLSPAASAWLEGRQSPPPRAVVVAALRCETANRVRGDLVHLQVKIESNLAGDQTLYSVEHWTFVRAANVRTKPPVRTRTWPCPNCGAPWQVDATDPNKCAYCGEVVAHGKFDWTVEAIRQDALRDVGPTLTGTVEEEGTDAFTIVDPVAKQTWAALQADDPAVTWDAFSGRVGLVYQRMNQGWNTLDLEPVRGLVTTAMLDFLRYWTDEYKRQGLLNKLEGASISKLALAKVRRDPYYDAVTVRVFAAGKDYTVDAGGDVVGGSRSNERAYTEYWTFLRASTRRGPIVAEPNCPNCGAPLAVAADSGACTHCNAVIDNGSFDFVLSKIEQDEVYEG